MREQTAQQPPIKRRASLHTQRSDDIEDLVGDEKYYQVRTPNSTRRYQDTRGNQIVRQGNKQLVIHYDQPPPQYLKRRHFHWLFWVGVVLFIAVVGTWLFNNVGIWVTNESNNLNYGYPRTYQTDAVVGHHDNPLHPTHFIVINLNGTIQIIEIQGGDPSHEKVYVGPTIYSPNPDLVPATLSFQDVNGDGKVDMLLHIQGQTIVFLNQGSQFGSAQK